jgi:hypothetical protein
MGDIEATFNLNLDDHYDNATRAGHVQLGRWRTLNLWCALLMIATLVHWISHPVPLYYGWIWFNLAQCGFQITGLQVLKYSSPNTVTPALRAGVTLNVIFVMITLAVMGAAQVCLSHFS